MFFIIYAPINALIYSSGSFTTLLKSKVFITESWPSADATTLAFAAELQSLNLII